MDAKFQPPKGQEGTTSALNKAVAAVKLAEKNSAIQPAKAAFRSIGILLTSIRDSTVDEPDHVELGLFCGKISQTLDCGTNGKKLDELSQPVRHAINLLTVTVADIQKKLVERDARNAVSRRFHAKKDKKTIAAWKLELDKISQTFDELVMNEEITTRPDVTNTSTTIPNTHNGGANAHVIGSDTNHNLSKSSGDTSHQGHRTHASAPGESPPPPPPRSAHGTVSSIRHDIVTRTIVSELERNVTSAHTMVSDIHRTIVRDQEGDSSKKPLAQTIIPGESPPSPPRTFFGRDELVRKICDLAENLTPIALIGAGGIGKTSIAMAILHHDRIKRRFGNDRRFIRCDQFLASRAHFLRRLSKVTGAGVENPEDLTSLYPFLASREMLIVLDNAESILDPRGTNAQDIYAVVEELSRLNNICVFITSRITTTPPDCRHIDVPTLSMDAARNTFYGIYDNGNGSDLVDNILNQLDFHPLSVTLLATVARHNRWDLNRLAREWEKGRTGVLQTEHNKSLATTIELSLASPQFQELGPDARALLGVIAFFPQGIYENSLDVWFPSISNRTNVFDKFCVLSLTHRSNGFVTMLAPLRDYFSPKDPRSSSLLCTVKERYFIRLSVHPDPNNSQFVKTRWITVEDTNIEHLLDIFTTIDASSDQVWKACADFMQHLYWHKKRLTILKPKVEGLPDDHSSKPECLTELARLSREVGNLAECKRLLTRALKLLGERGSDPQVARILRTLSDTNRLMDLCEEGIQQAKEALEIHERLGDTSGQVECLINLAFLYRKDKQLDAAEEAASHAISLSVEKGQQFQLCESHRVLGKIYQAKGETEKAISHFEVALRIASPFNWHSLLFWTHYNLAVLFRDEGRFEDTHAHIERAKPHTVGSAYKLGRAMELQAGAWYRQHRLEEARSEALRAVNIYEKHGAAGNLSSCRRLLQDIQKKLNDSA